MTRCTQMHPICTQKQKRDYMKSCNPLNLLVRPAGFEPAAYGFEVRRSIQLSYGRAFKPLEKKIPSCPISVSGSDFNPRITHFYVCA